VGDGEITHKIKSFADFLGRIDISVDAALAAALSGKRAFVASKADYKSAALMRTPLVGVSENPLAARDSGAIIFLPETSQEVFDSIIIAYTVIEDRKIMLPAVVGVDFLAARTRETVDLPTQKIIENYMPPFIMDRPEKHMLYALSDTVDAKAQLQSAMDNAKKALPAAFNKWKARFRHQYSAVEKMFVEDADIIIVTYGSISGNAKLAVKKLRASGEKVGLLRLRVLRPFPEGSLAALSAKKIAVVEPTHAAGRGGILCNEIGGDFCSSFICGKSVSARDFEDIFRRMKSAEKPERIWMM